MKRRHVVGSMLDGEHASGCAGFTLHLREKVTARRVRVRGDVGVDRAVELARISRETSPVDDRGRRYSVAGVAADPTGDCVAICRDGQHAFHEAVRCAPRHEQDRIVTGQGQRRACMAEQSRQDAPALAKMVR